MCQGRRAGEQGGEELRVAGGGQGRVWRGQTRLGPAEASGTGCPGALGPGRLLGSSLGLGPRGRCLTTLFSSVLLHSCFRLGLWTAERSCGSRFRSLDKGFELVPGTAVSAQGTRQD